MDACFEFLVLVQKALDQGSFSAGLLIDVTKIVWINLYCSRNYHIVELKVQLKNFFIAIFLIDTNR